MKKLSALLLMLTLVALGTACHKHPRPSHDNQGGGYSSPAGNMGGQGGPGGMGGQGGMGGMGGQGGPGSR